MNTTTRTIISVLAVWVFLYLFGAFISAEFNPFIWQPQARALYALTSLIASCVAIALSGLWKTQVEVGPGETWP